MRDPAVLALRARMRLMPDVELTRALPPRQAIVEVTTRDGRRLAHRSRAVRGTPDNPMERREVEAKALDLLAPVLGKERAHALAAQVWRSGVAAGLGAALPDSRGSTPAMTFSDSSRQSRRQSEREHEG
jgi:2-methylcitrate dehydratase PrpD